MLGAAPPVAAQPLYPTVTIEIVRIAEMDALDVAPTGDWDWYYWFGVFNGTSFSWTRFDAPNGPNVTVGQSHEFEAQATVFRFAIVLCEGDTLSADDAADISSQPGGGADDSDCPVGPVLWPLGTYQGSWDLTQEALGGDSVVSDAGAYRASGDLDGSTAVDENDASLWFRVSDNYALPVADAGPDHEGWLNDSFLFDGRNSTGGNASLESYEWDFNDDQITDANGPVVIWRFTAKGQFPVILRVTDSLGQTNVDVAFVTIQNRGPNARFVFLPSNPKAGETVFFADASSDIDGTVVRWEWHFGDGPSGRERDPTHVYRQAGSYNVTLVVFDDDGGTAFLTRTVVIASSDGGSLLWVGGIVLIVVVALLAYGFWWFRKHPPSEL